MIVLAGNASTVAYALHSGQFRWDGEPYYNHVERVAVTMRRQDASTTVVAAAFLHDVVEDTDVTFLDLRDTYQIPVPAIALVRVLTRRENELYTSYIERIAVHPDAAAIKRADLIDNMSTLPPGHGLWKRYLKALQTLHNV